MKTHPLIKFFFSFLIFFIALESGLRALSLFYRNQINDSKSTDEFIILTLGESTTADTATPDVLSWPIQLQKIIDLKHLNIRIINEAVSATTTNALLKRLPNLVLKHNPDLIITMMGINDYSRFWNKKFIITTDENLLSHIKIFKLLQYLKKSDVFNKKDETSMSVEAFSSLRYPKLDKIIADLKNAKYKSAKFTNLVKKINVFLSDKTPVEKAQFYNQIAKKIHPPYTKNGKAYEKVYYFYLLSIKAEPRQPFIAEEALHFAITTDIRSDCKNIADLIAEHNAKTSDTFLLRLATCIPNEVEYLNAYFKSAGDNFEYRTIDTLPTQQNYDDFQKIITENDICWIAMNYPFRNETPYLNKLSSLNSSKIFTLNNKDNFDAAIRKHSFNELFYDNFAGDFGHTTSLGSQLIAENVFNKLMEIRNRCNKVF